MIAHADALWTQRVAEVENLGARCISEMERVERGVGVEVVKSPDLFKAIDSLPQASRSSNKLLCSKSPPHLSWHPSPSIETDDMTGHEIELFDIHNSNDQ
jgi:hypothetical protein